MEVDKYDMVLEMLEMHKIKLKRYIFINIFLNTHLCCQGLPWKSTHNLQGFYCMYVMMKFQVGNLAIFVRLQGLHHALNVICCIFITLLAQVSSKPSKKFAFLKFLLRNVTTYDCCSLDKYCSPLSGKNHLRIILYIVWFVFVRKVEEKVYLCQIC